MAWFAKPQFSQALNGSDNVIYFLPRALVRRTRSCVCELWRGALWAEGAWPGRHSCSRTPAVWPTASAGQKLLLHLFAEWANCFLRRRQHELPLGSPALGRPEIRWAAGKAGLLPGPGTVSMTADVPTGLAPRAHHTSRAHKMDSSLLKSEPRN